LPYCPECGNEVEEGVSYCENCGERLDVDLQDSQDSFSNEEKETPPPPPKGSKKQPTENKTEEKDEVATKETPPPPPSESPEKQQSESKANEEKDEVASKDAAKGFLIIIVVIILVIGGIYLVWDGDDDEEEIGVLVEDIYALEIGDRVGLDVDMVVWNPTDKAVEVNKSYFELETDVGNTYEPLSQIPELDRELRPDEEVEFTLTFEIPLGETASYIHFNPPSGGSYEGAVGDY